MSAEATLATLAKIDSAPASSCFFQAWICVGWTSYWPASWLTVRSALWAARATLALNPAEWTLRWSPMVSPPPGRRSILTAGPENGVHYIGHVEAWVPAEVTRVYAIVDNLQAHRATDVLRF